MQLDKLLSLMARHPGLNSHQLASQSMLEGGDLWRHMDRLGVYEQSFKREPVLMLDDLYDLDRAFLSAIACKDLGVVHEFVETVFKGFDAPTINKWFHDLSRADDDGTLASCISDAFVYGGANHQAKAPSLSVALSLLRQYGLELIDRRPKDPNATRESENCLGAVIWSAAVVRDANQEDLMAAAKVYLSQGASMCEDPGGFEYSPLALLMGRGQSHMISKWADMLINEGHVTLEHMQQVRQLAAAVPQNIAVFDAYFARQEIMVIQSAAQAARP